MREPENLRDGKNRTRPALTVDEIYEYDIDTDPVLLEEYCAKANFVFNLAGVNRPKNEAEFMQGNFGFASTLLDMLKRHGQHLPGHAVQQHPGNAHRPLRPERLRQKQTGGRGIVLYLRPGDRCAGAGLPLPEPVR